MNTVMIDMTSSANSVTGSLILSLSTTVRMAPCCLNIKSNKSNPNLQSLSLWATTTSPIVFLKSRSNMVCSPFLLKLSPDA